MTTKKLKLLSIFFCIFILFGSSCQKVNPLYEAVNELRSNLFYGESQDYKLEACYGFTTTVNADLSEKVYALTFRLIEKEVDQANYSISMVYNEKDYSANFKLNPITHTLTARIEIENFSEKEFSVSMKKAEDCQTLTLCSTLPDGAISYKTALDHLSEKQSDLIKSYTDENGNFTAKICARIIVKNQKPYWYVGFTSANGDLKALLIDGITGETLAIREIF